MEAYQPEIIRLHIPYPEVNDFFDAFLHETVRLTHNLVASVATVIDITRRILDREWPDREHAIRKEFFAAADVFRTDGRLVVVRDLRNYCLHRSLPPVKAEEKWSRDEGHSASILLNTEVLLQWDKWKSPARKLLEDAGPSIELAPLIQGYVHQAITLHESTVASIKRYEKDVVEPWENVAALHDTLVGDFVERLKRDRDNPTGLNPE